MRSSPAPAPTTIPDPFELETPKGFTTPDRASETFPGLETDRVASERIEPTAANALPPRPNPGPDPWPEPDGWGDVLTFAGLALILTLALSFAFVARRIRHRRDRAAATSEALEGQADGSEDAPVSPTQRLIETARTVRDALSARYGPAWESKTTEEIAIALNDLAQDNQDPERGASEGQNGVDSTDVSDDPDPVLPLDDVRTLVDLLRQADHARFRVATPAEPDDETTGLDAQIAHALRCVDQLGTIPSGRVASAPASRAG